MSASILQVPAECHMMRGSYTPRGGIPRGFYWDPSKGGEVVLDPEPAPLRAHSVVVGADANAGSSSVAIGSSAASSKNDSVVVGADPRPFSLVDEIDAAERRVSSALARPIVFGVSAPSDPSHGSLYYDATRSALMMYDGTRHIPISSALTGDEKRGPWCVAPCSTCGVQVRSFREPTDRRPIYCGDCPNPHNVGGAKCLVEGCRIGIFEDEVFCSRCVKDPVIWSSLLGGLGALYLAARGATLVLSVPHNLQVFYLIGMLLIAVKAVRMILKGARGR